MNFQRKRTGRRSRLLRRCALLLALMLCLPTGALAAMSGTAVRDTVTNTAQYVYQTVKAPQVGSTGGEWAVLGLARSGYPVADAYYQNYYAAVETCVKACGGRLHDKKYTEYSRVILALSSIGRDARDVAGYDLTRPLGDYDKTVWQGLNGPIWALIALDSRDYPMPENPEAATQATRQMYVDRILSCRLPDGGWSLSGGSSDPDITGMALQALAKYQDQPAVAQATREALACMSGMQDPSGGFSTWGSGNSEGVVQMLVALTELGIPLDDPQFVKNGKTLLDALLAFSLPDGSFLHTAGDAASNQMATEQALYGLAAVQRASLGKNSLYRIGDAAAVAGGEEPQPGSGLPGKDPAVKAVPITQAGKTFSDLSANGPHPNQAAIEALAARGILDGKGGGRFDPDATMTRAEFAAIAVRALGLTPAANDAFTDVEANAWYASYIGAASSYGLIQGVGGGKFNPGGTITRQEAAVLVTRAAGLCGMDTRLDSSAVRDALAQFTDYVTAADWARPGLAFCYSAGILDDSALEIQPGVAIKRCEVAQMVFQLLGEAKLL